MQEMPQNNEQINNKTNKLKEFYNKHFYLSLAVIGLVVILFSVLFDQITKIIAVNSLQFVGNSVPFIPGFIDFTLVYNTGAAWGIGGDNTASRIILIIISWIVAVGLIGYFVYCYFKKKEIKFGLFIICSFIVGGDIGNLIDRTFFYDRGVIDFISIQSWWPNFGIFNIADSILVCSIIALIIYLIVNYIKEYKNEKKRVDSKDE